MQVTQDELKRYEELQVIALDFARQGKTQDLKLMLQAGMPVNLSDHKGNSLIMLASYNGNLETTSMLVDFGADVDKKNDKGQTPLAGVCFKGYLDIVKVLVKAGANIHQNNGMGTTPLMFASIFGNYEIVKFLSEENKKLNLKFLIYLYLSRFLNFFKSFFK
jgi:ankyrin repeat protein